MTAETSDLIQDHREVDRLLARWQQEPTGCDRQQALIEKICDRICQHLDDEQPLLDRAEQEQPELVEHLRAEQRRIGAVIHRLRTVPAHDSTFHSLVRRLINLFRNHAHETETQLRPGR